MIFMLKQKSEICSLQSLFKMYYYIDKMWNFLSLSIIFKDFETDI